jgi:predicted aspartyl protease
MRIRLGLVCLFVGCIWTQTCFAQTEAAAFAPQIKAELAALSENGRAVLSKALIACSLYVDHYDERYEDECKRTSQAFKVQFSNGKSSICLVLEGAIIATQIAMANTKLSIAHGELPSWREVNQGKAEIEALQKAYRDANSATRVSVQEGQRRSSPSSGASILIPVQEKGGTYTVPVLINKAITLNFIIDSGSSDVSIPADVVMTLVRAGTIEDTDFIGRQTYKLADGTSVPSPTFRIRSLTMNKLVIENVKGSVAAAAGELLLGQSFLNRFKSWSIDNAKQALVLTR